jgi:hypothetical protein
MKILHLSYHVGCINDINYIFSKLGHSITSERCSFPYHIPQNKAIEYWNDRKDYYQSFDIIITSDTVAISYIFLLQLDILTPHLIILNCNRFDYSMTSEQKFYNLLREIKNKPDKITYIPYTTFEKIWCAKHGISVTEQTIEPVGKVDNSNPYICPNIQNSFGSINTQLSNGKKEDTIFIQTYHNHIKFMNLPYLLYTKGISVEYGGYDTIEQLNNYKAIVVFPDAFSKYFITESIQNNIIVLLPSQEFLLELVSKTNYFFNIEGSSGKLQRDWLNLCDWYKYAETRIYFNSFNDMFEKIVNIDKTVIETKKRWMAFYGKSIEEEGLLKWKYIFDKIEIKMGGLK